MTILIRYTGLNTVRIYIQKKKGHDNPFRKGETQGGGVNIMPSFIARPLASFPLFSFF